MQKLKILVKIFFKLLNIGLSCFSLPCFVVRSEKVPIRTQFLRERERERVIMKSQPKAISTNCALALSRCLLSLAFDLFLSSILFRIHGRSRSHSIVCPLQCHTWCCCIS